jgi:Holliday junction resolvase RusA-like endonuclease
MPKNYMQWRLLFRQQWHNCVPRFPPFDIDISLKVTFFTKTGNMRPDLDNAVAAVLDALQDVRAITNDRYVKNISCDVVKSQDKRNSIVIELTTVFAHTSPTTVEVLIHKPESPQTP